MLRLKYTVINSVAVNQQMFTLKGFVNTFIIYFPFCNHIYELDWALRFDYYTSEPKGSIFTNLAVKRRALLIVWAACQVGLCRLAIRSTIENWRNEDLFFFTVQSDKTQYLHCQCLLLLLFVLMLIYRSCDEIYSSMTFFPIMKARGWWDKTDVIT